MGHILLPVLLLKVDLSKMLDLGSFPYLLYGGDRSLGISHKGQTTQCASIIQPYEPVSST